MIRQPFNADWVAGPKASPFGALAGGPATTQRVTLPHDAIRDLARSAASDQGSHTGYFPGGAFTYTKTFDVPEGWRDKTVVIAFEGVYRDAVVYINGEFAAQRPSGYAGFAVTADPFLRYGQANTIGLRAPADLKFPGDYFATRSRGYITPAVSGDYTFWISSRTSAELWLSTDDAKGKYAKQRIARIDTALGGGHGIGASESNLWDRFSSQRSVSVRLEAGHSYYVEILHQHGHTLDAHSSIAWMAASNSGVSCWPERTASAAVATGSATSAGAVASARSRSRSIFLLCFGVGASSIVLNSRLRSALASQNASAMFFT